MSKSNWIEEKNAPGKTYRGKPFWSWNGDLDENTLRKQIKILKEMGQGGFFMHSRTGLKTPYLSEKWFDGVKACVDEAKELDMEAWIYDEDRWPSGFAGGLVTKNKKYQMGHLYFKEIKKYLANKDEKLIALFKGVKSNGVYSQLKQISKNQKGALKKNEVFLYFYYAKDPKHNAYNGETYVDTMNKDAIREFIKITHDAYKKNVGKNFNKEIPGVFTDEPNYGFYQGSHDQNKEKGATLHGKVCWTDSFPSEFKKRYGYDLLPYLAEIFLEQEGGSVSAHRWRYFNLLTQLFSEAYFKQIGDWCDKNHLMHTGHVLEEPTLVRQTRRVGSAMRAYEYMQAPGMDSLTEYWREYDTAKQLSSVARQLNKKWRLTETYGCTGWDFSFKGQKTNYDLQSVLGINLRCQHLSWYTMEGQAKRDYPASIFYQSPWWQRYHYVEDYFARLNLMQTQGKEVRDLLMVHPVESLWSIYTGKQTEEVALLEKDFREMMETLLRGLLDFDLGDEDIMSRHYRIIKKGGKTILKIGEAEYKSIVLPSMLTMRKTTFTILKEFKKQGGQILFGGKSPENVDGEFSKELIDFISTCDYADLRKEDFLKKLEDCRRVKVTCGKQEISSLLYSMREDNDFIYLYLINIGQDVRAREPIPVEKRTIAYKDLSLTLLDEKKYYPVEFNLLTGEMKPLSTIGASNQVQFDLEGTESKMIIFAKKKSLLKSLSPRNDFTVFKKQKLSAKKMNTLQSEWNNLPLDMAYYQINGKKYSKEKYILEVDQEVRACLGLPPREGKMIQPWCLNHSKKGKSAKVTLEYHFKMQGQIKKALFLAIENPTHFKISLNGHNQTTTVDCGWWVDESLRLIRLEPYFFTQDHNVLQLELDYEEGFAGLESIFLLGDFYTKTKGGQIHFADKPSQLKLGDWTKQGYSFYAGNMGYGFEYQHAVKNAKKVELYLPHVEGVASEIIINNQAVGLIPWSPQKVDITKFLKVGQNKIDVIVLGHRRNSHGPFYLDEASPSWTGPFTFVHNREDRQLVPCGLMKEPEIIIYQ